jgi:hypothetical protein
MRIKLSEIRQIIREEIREAAKKTKRPLKSTPKKNQRKAASDLADDPGPTFQDMIGFAKGWQAMYPEAYAENIKGGNGKKIKEALEIDPEFLEIMKRGKAQRRDFEMNMPKAKEDKIDYYAKKFAEYYQDKDVMSYASGIDVEYLIRQFEDVAAGYDEYNIMSYPMYKGWTPEDFGKIVELFYKYDDEMQNPAV